MKGLRSKANQSRFAIGRVSDPRSAYTSRDPAAPDQPQALITAASFTSNSHHKPAASPRGLFAFKRTIMDFLETLKAAIDPLTIAKMQGKPEHMLITLSDGKVLEVKRVRAKADPAGYVAELLANG
jgi:hypothetical protein